MCINIYMRYVYTYICAMCIHTCMHMRGEYAYASMYARGATGLHVKLDPTFASIETHVQIRHN